MFKNNRRLCVKIQNQIFGQKNPGEGYSSRMSAPSPQPIAVNFNIVIDASGNLEVFNAAAPVVSNVIVAERTLPVTALYDPDNTTGLLELWEPESAQGDIYVQLADTNRTSSGGLNFSGAYQTASKAIAAGLEHILCDKFDCSGAAPFSSYTSNVEYYKQRDFGRVALATYAHHLFGHVDATAAITNDKAFVEAMLSTSAGGADESAGGVAARYGAWTKSTAANVQLWDDAASSSDANLAIRLVKALVGKGLDGSGVPTVSNVNAGDPATLANIVSQVVGQDASRLMNVDNSQRTRDQHVLLRFYAGDVFYLNVTLKSPNVNIGSTNQLVSKAALEAMYPSANNNFTIKMTLGSGAGAAPAPAVTFTSSFSPVAGLVILFYAATQAYGFGQLGLYKLVGSDYVKTDDLGGTPVGNWNWNSNNLVNGDQIIVLASQAATVPVAGAPAISNLFTVAV